MNAAHTAFLFKVLSIVSSAGAATGELELGRGPHLFIDDALIASESGLRRVISEPARLAEPIVTGPEDKCFQPYVTVLQDPATKRFRIWYGVPESESQSHLAYMESEDGIHWKRPHRVLKDPGRIQFGVSILDEGPAFAERGKRFKYGYWYDGGLQIAASPDGLDWQPLAPGPVLRHDHDINSIFRDPIRKRYVAMVSTYTEGKGWSGKRRIPMQSVSDDLIQWAKPHVVIAPDEKDEGETQFYCMGGLIARGPLLIGMLKVLRDDLPANAGERAAGIGYTVLAWSRDGETWHRDRQPFLPRNPKPGTWDHAMTWADCQLIVGNETFIYYGGYARGHKTERFKERQIGLARMPLDRYVAREAVQEGRLLTQRLRMEGERITLNAKVDGQLRVRAIGSNGDPLPGFDLADCEPLRGDSLRHELRWKGGIMPPAGQRLQLEFVLERGRLYAMTIH